MLFSDCNYCIYLETYNENGFLPFDVFLLNRSLEDSGAKMVPT